MNTKSTRTSPTLTTSESQEVKSSQSELIQMSDEEEDLISRMHRLVGERWDLIAGRVPGRKPEEIQQFWMVKKQLARQHGS